MLGCSHTDSYTELLEELASNPRVLGRVTLLEGSPFSDRMTALPYLKVKLPGVFHHTKVQLMSPPGLCNEYPANPVMESRSLSGASQAFTPRTTTPYSPVFSPHSTMAQLSMHTRMNGEPHIRSDSIGSSLMSTSDASINASSNGGAWAKMAKGAAALPLTDMTVRQQSQMEVSHPVSVIIRRNRKGQRIDDPLPYDREEVQAMKKQKYCNQHYIGVGCCHHNANKTEKCPHRHDKTLNKAQLATLRVVARETPCKRGTDCDDPKCIYGHRCPFPAATEGTMRGIGCLNGENCRFPRDMHAVECIPIKYTRVTGAF